MARSLEHRDFPSLLAALQDEAGATPDRPALRFYRGRQRTAERTLAQLTSEVSRLASHLASRGVSRGDRVALLTPNRIEVPALLLAGLRLGATLVPLNPNAPQDEWRYVLGHSQPVGLIGRGDLLALLDDSATPGAFRIDIATSDALPAGAALPEAPADLHDERAVVLYTSGTTGNPKGVALSQRNLLENGWSMAENFALDGTTQLAVLPLYHAHAFGFGFMTALLRRGLLVFVEKLDPFAWAQVIADERVEITSVVPSLLPVLLGARVTRAAVPTLRAVLVSSAPLTVELTQRWEEAVGVPLVQGWGLSEYTNFACCLSPALPDDERRALLGLGAAAGGAEGAAPLGSIGPALPGVEVVAMGPDGRILDENEPGELCVRGPSRMIEYFRDPEATARTIAPRPGVSEPGWLHTGDEGMYRLHRGVPHFFITGRIKEIIIRGGEKYAPLAIERRLAEGVPDLAGRFVVLGFAHAQNGEEVGCYLEVEGGALSEADRARLTSALAAIPVAERPKVLLFGAAPIPRTHTGKIQRRKLQPLFARFSDHRGAVRIEPA